MQEAHTNIHPRHFVLDYLQIKVESEIAGTRVVTIKGHRHRYPIHCRPSHFPLITVEYRFKCRPTQVISWQLPLQSGHVT